MKDNFSNRSDKYQKFRPGYPQGLYDFLLSVVTQKGVAWDCGTGNGQVAQELAKYFNKVYATDISKTQIEHAVQRDNIFYSVEPAEKTSFLSNTFDLVTVAQAIHWFNFELFYTEVERTIKPGGIIAVIGYGLFNSDQRTDEIINMFYREIIGSYWDSERRYIDENYETIPFPFAELTAPKFENIFKWTFDQLIGYLETWSAVQHYIKKNNSNPLDLVYNHLKNAWGDQEFKQIRFPILLRVGMVLQ
jgi:Methylase involved in ubiquinone/menaquinone biosynthesis